tara:strand:+ start:1193 stop:1855 length:663 start_codon:yes stop_codon:yes gene_type:complete
LHRRHGVFLIGFERQYIVRASLMDLGGNGRLSSHGVNGDGGTAQVHGGEQSWDGFHLVALLLADHLAGTQAVGIHPGPQQMDPVTAQLRIVSAAQSLAIDGHVQALKRSAPLAQNVEQGLGVQHHEDIAEDIVGRCPVLKGEKTAQPWQLTLGEILHVGEAIRIAKHRTKGAHEHLIEAVEDFAGLAAVRELGEGGPQALQHAQIRLGEVGWGRWLGFHL